MNAPVHDKGLDPRIGILAETVKQWCRPDAFGRQEGWQVVCEALAKQAEADRERLALLERKCMWLSLRVRELESGHTGEGLE